MVRVYVSPDLGIPSSGDIVSRNEREFLESIEDDVISIGHHIISPLQKGLPNSPFLMDYITQDFLADLVAINKVKHTSIDHVHFYSGPFTNTIRYLKALNIKTSVTCDAHDRIESIQEFENLGIQYPFNHVSDNRLWNMYSSYLKEADLVIVPSTLSRDFLVQERVNPDKIKIIPHGVDLPEHWQTTNIPEPFNFGYLGQTGPDKGLKYLIQAWSKLNYKDATLVIAGPNSDLIDDFIKKYAIGGKYHLMGYVQNVDDFFSQIAVYIQPSVTEGFGIEVLEAMARGKPVIVSDGAGAGDLVVHGENGYLFTKRNIDFLAHNIELMKNTSNLTGKSTNARKTAENYSWDNIKEEYIKAWNSLM